MASEEPEFIAQRIAIFDRLYKAYIEAQEKLPHEEIDIDFGEGKVVKGTSNKTTPLDALKSAKMANGIVAVKVDGELYHINKPLTKSCKIEAFKFEDKIGNEVFWHSSAHVLGAVLEQKYSALLGVGPAIEKGFYYDAVLKDNKILSLNELPEIEKAATAFAKGGYDFIELDVSKKDALELFAYNKFKVELITEKVADDDMCRVFRCGTFIDFCRGPHVPNTRVLEKEFHIKNASAAYWKGNQKNDSMQRVYGISFPNNSLYKAYVQRIEEMKKRKHTVIGVKQELFLIHPLSPGCPIFLPAGTRVYRCLESLIRNIYWEQGYEEVLTPTFYNVDLWKTSGHWDHYKDNMYGFDIEGQKFGLKPMNCPGHCLIFKSKPRSFNELPLRIADFGEIHRNELSGTIRGLSRVRRFHQDDAHIFCPRSLIKEEITKVLKFVDDVYGIFGFTYKLGLSTRPEGSIGSDENWENAETALKQALDDTGKPYAINPGDGAFYGPKIDIELNDAFGNPRQCATCQLDFNLPERFGLVFTNKTGVQERPVMIHRAILGSVERFMGVLIESINGKWPFWISPRQIYICTAHGKTDEDNAAIQEYANNVWKLVHNEYRFYAELDNSNDNVGTKVQKGRENFYNYILVIGKKEVDEKTVSVTCRDAPRTEKAKVYPLDDFLKMCDNMRKNHK